MAPLPWKDPAAREPREVDRDEFPEALDLDRAAGTRRSFLKLAGFTFAGAWAAACQRAPVERAIPYLVQPESLTPGRSYFYASTCAGCSAGCGLLVKTRDGRPIKLEGNPDHPVSRGGACAPGQASILGLYDSQRLEAPMVGGARTTWAAMDAELLERFEDVRRRRGAVRVLTGTITSPTLAAHLTRFLSSFADARHVVYDPISVSAILDAYATTHGIRLLPRYRFDRARVVAAFDADFLGTWISPVEFARAWADARRVAPGGTSMSYHAQFESRMSLTGGKADRRVRVAPGDLGPMLTRLAARIGARAGVDLGIAAAAASPAAAEIDDIADRLWAARGQSLVACGSQRVEDQVLCNVVNDLLGSYGATLDVARPSFQRQGSDADALALVDEIAAGRVAALIVAGVNPVYDLPAGRALAAQLETVPIVVSLAERMNETAAHARYVCPDHHYLEAWGDAEPVAGTVSLAQPAIHPLGSTRAAIETLAVWNGQPATGLDLIRQHWREEIFPRAGAARSFDSFWDATLERGAADVSVTPLLVRSCDRSTLRAVAAPEPAETGALSLVLYPKVGMLDGRHAHNPWLQELPDPVSKVTWGNYACLSPATAAALGLADGDLVRIETAGGPHSEGLELPAFVQPGQHDGIVAVALGYGRAGTERFAHIGPRWLEARPTGGPDGIIGVNAAPLVGIDDRRLQYAGRRVTLTRTGARRALASTQAHHSLTPPPALSLRGVEPRPIVQETTLAALAAGSTGDAGQPEAAATLWPEDHPHTGHRWALAVDLSACTGCSACVIACQVENNVPVVGEDEVRRHREMHWIRLDRYYAGDGGDVDVVQQPMMCQHCDHAPCETVCPVLATVHSDEGLNEQVYNRCVGTRYCANNCPYKVRRFNWFNYPHEDRLANLVLNPDVTVRSRGVMEKCSLCVQRIQEARMEARAAGRAIADGDVQTACQQTCPAQAIVFGDANDPKSRVARLLASPRAYRVLDELGVRPSIAYLKVVRNRAPRGEAPHV